MQSKIDSLSAKNDLGESTLRDIQFEEAYQRFLRPIKGLCAMVENNTNKLHEDERNEIIKEMFIQFECVGMFRPYVSKKETYEFKDVVDAVKFADKCNFGNNLSNEQAIEQAHEIKQYLLDKEANMEINQLVDSLKKLAEDHYERNLTKLHCKELVIALNEYKQLLITHYFNNDPYEVRSKMNQDLHCSVNCRGIDLGKQDKAVIKQNGYCFYSEANSTLVRSAESLPASPNHHA